MSMPSTDVPDMQPSTRARRGCEYATTLDLMPENSNSGPQSSTEMRSDRTPYVAGAMRAARAAGALTVLVSSSPSAPLAASADYSLLVDTGPEAIAGSTRLKAATAQKMILNSLSTAVMIKLGRTYSNL